MDETEPKSRSWLWITIIIIILVIGIALGFYFYSGRNQAIEPGPLPEAPANEATAPTSTVNENGCPLIEPKCLSGETLECDSGKWLCVKPPKEETDTGGSPDGFK